MKDTNQKPDPEALKHKEDVAIKAKRRLKIRRNLEDITEAKRLGIPLNEYLMGVL